MRSFLVFGVIATLGCSSPNTPGTGSAGVVEPAPAAKAVSVCTYPEAPYGKAVGQTIPPTLTWSGYGPGGQPMTYKSTDFFDCDGSKGINAIVFDSSATWCGACQAEASELEGFIKSNWGANGVAVITLMVEDANHKPPSSIAVAQEWMTQFHLNNVPVAINPSFDFALYANGSLGLPYNVLVNPRNMQVVKSPYNPGAGGHDANMDALLAANQAQ